MTTEPQRVTTMPGEPIEFVISATDPYAAAMLRDLACRQAAAGDDDQATKTRRAARAIDEWREQNVPPK